MKHRGTSRPQKILRRDKGKPCDDLRHNLAVGLPLALALFVVLPPLFRLIF